MTELSLNPELPSSKLSVTDPPPGGWKRPIIAAILSFIFAGLGQLYNRQVGKAIVFCLVGPAVDVLGGCAGLFHGLTGLTAMVIFSAGWRIFVVADAFVNARRQTLTGHPSSVPRAASIPVFLLTLIPLFLYGFGTNYFFDHVARVRAYRVPSASNCPTVCEGERMIADPSAYWGKSPQHGDIVIFKREEFDSLLFKRVVGLPGDVIAQSDNGILVNGKPAALVDLARICGNPPELDHSYLPIPSKTVTVPADSLYVVGDNRSNSFDSRIEQFGFVPMKNVRGRPLFLYWSPYKNRIGCHLR